MRKAGFLFLLWGLLGWAASASAMPLAVLDQTATILAEAEASNGPAFNTEVAGDSAVDNSPFSRSVRPSAMVADVLAAPEVILISILDDDLIWGRSALKAVTDGPLGSEREPDDDGLAFAESFLDVLFSVTGDMEFRISGSVQTEVDDISDAMAAAELVNVATMVSLFSFEVDSSDSGSPQSFLDFMVLEPGDYRLTGSASATAPFDELAVRGDGSARASFSVRVAVIPEPSMALLLGGGLALLAASRRR